MEEAQEDALEMAKETHAKRKESAKE